ncbi:hypothetical protein RHMOL_Rhmol04G0148900 [Rhododendron molle]|uniref:Uncharacterized protein n=1 Tax=Rhododendron molle TaxID=49168 RepID=A0ACC0P0J8_RHOML|nr:hypothetical protein RHMOL_Rhmol04G0148900 [Rhododendron molle]
MIFLLAEMGTSGSLDGQQRLVIQGRFVPKNFEGILRRYIMIGNVIVSHTFNRSLVASMGWMLEALFLNIAQMTMQM